MSKNPAATTIRDRRLQNFSIRIASKKCMSNFATRLGWTGWLLVLVYFGALTAISDYIAHWFLFSEELLFYEVFITVIISTFVLYILSRVYSVLRDKNSTSKWWDRGLKILSIIFGLIGFVYLGIGLISYLSIDDFRTDPELRNLDSELQSSFIENSYFFGILLTISGVIAFVATAGATYSGSELTRTAVLPRGRRMRSSSPTFIALARVAGSYCVSSDSCRTIFAWRCSSTALTCSSRTPFAFSATSM